MIICYVEVPAHLSMICPLLLLLVYWINYLFSHFHPFMFVSDTLSPPKKEKLALLDASIGLFVCKEVRTLYGN